MGKIPKDSWAIIERVIRRYPESKMEYDDTLEISMHDSPGKNNTQILRGGNTVGNPTERIALKLHTPRMERLSREIKAVEEVYNELPPEHQKVIRTRYWSDRSRNKPYLWVARFVDYEEGQIKRISQKFVRKVGKKLGEI